MMFGGLNGGDLPFDPEKLNDENALKDPEVRSFLINELGIPEEVIDSDMFHIVNITDMDSNEKSKLPDILSSTNFIKKVIDGDIDSDSILNAMSNPEDPLNKDIINAISMTKFAQDNFKAFKTMTSKKMSKILTFLDAMGETVCIIDSPVTMNSWLYFENGINNIKLFKNIGRSFVDWNRITTKSKKLSVLLYPSSPIDIEMLFKKILSSN